MSQQEWVQQWVFNYGYFNFHPCGERVYLVVNKSKSTFQYIKYYLKKDLKMKIPLHWYFSQKEILNKF